jgi:phosphoglycerol transferase MdoB-like AlkP superfamily enzyme
MRHFWHALRPFLFLFIAIESLLRLSLLARGLWEVDIATPDILQILLRGLWLDLATAGWALLPVAVVKLIAPASFWERNAGRLTDHLLRLLFVGVLLFDAVAEHLFWSEFSTRFNFIAVDYLVYTQEVIGNIVESYPVGWMLAAIGAVSAGILWGLHRRLPPVSPAPFRARLAGFGAYLLLCGGVFALSNAEQAQFGHNAEAEEIAANGMYNLFHAFWHNEISYERFYARGEPRRVSAHARKLLTEANETMAPDGRIRLVQPAEPEQHPNVMLVVMESMSAEYMGVFGNTQKLTPNLDRLAQNGLSFTQTYATGTRTVRGLEAVTLSLPPTPGQSILRRPGNENLFSLGFIFKDRGYRTQFLYGGYGYFDNMNSFFAGNGFDVIDHTHFAKDEIHFSNVWGVADEDLFAHAIREADRSFAAGTPFMQLIMTTSNHRPYTFPEGRIDRPSKSGRLGGVQYADYSIGKLVEWAETKPWFKDTLFVFVADHTAGAGGKAELDPKKYHIPMIFYAPGRIAPQKFEAIASQIDLAPILLGQLHFHYRTKFYGEDLMHDMDEIPHAFISNYQKVALVKEGTVTVLSPKRQIAQYHWPEAQPEPQPKTELVKDAVAYYQSASWWRDTYKREPTVIQ